jgi:hypothetical protein
MEAEREVGTEEGPPCPQPKADGVYGKPLGELTGRTEINGGEGPGVLILKYVSADGDDVYENFEMKMPHFISPHGKLILTMTNKNGVYLGKCITFRNNWDFVACANEAVKGDARIAFNWRNKYDNAVEITSTYFGRYNTGSTGTVMLPSMAKMKGLMRETIEEEMVDPVLFDVRDGGTESQVGYMSHQIENKFVQDRMESGIFRGIETAGIVFNGSMTGWRYAVDVCEHCKQETCEWEEKKEEMVSYNETISGDTTNKARRHSLYRQMAIKINDGKPLGRGNRMKLPTCVVEGIRELCPAQDGIYVGHQDAPDTEE